ncbi:MAG TPA: hypothetical protein VFK25_12095 [Candidatus Binatia bacterium]|nr:hypothetical protein [Candidatus Binatia bacterium]
MSDGERAARHTVGRGDADFDAEIEMDLAAVVDELGLLPGESIYSI